MRIDRRVALLLAVVALGFALGGCGWFGGKTKEYETSREERPLEVPPDLDAPATDERILAACDDPKHRAETQA